MPACRFLRGLHGIPRLNYATGRRDGPAGVVRGPARFEETAAGSVLQVQLGTVLWRKNVRTSRESAKEQMDVGGRWPRNA